MAATSKSDRQVVVQMGWHDELGFTRLNTLLIKHPERSLSLIAELSWSRRIVEFR
jgi:hypothetical protein